MKKVNIISLGCSKNLVDSEFLASYLKKNNVEVEFEGDEKAANTVIINTCGFINDAKEESIDYILNFANLKTQGKIKELYVMGCLSQRYMNEMKEQLPEVDGIYGVNDIRKIVKRISKKEPETLSEARFISTPNHYAFLKIAEGCDRKCAFCSIPQIRGKHKSIPIEELVEQACKLVEKGVKELIVISQDPIYYGKDLYGKSKFLELTQKLANIKGLQWLRLHYFYPDKLVFDIIDLMKENPKICNYLDIPFQHASDKILKAMHRGHNEKLNRQIIDYFRKQIPDGALRTSLIVGFPGETDEDFDKLLNFVEEVEFDRLGLFSYSNEENTTAYSYPDQVEQEIIDERIMQIEEIQADISLEKNTAKVGEIFKTLIDSYENGYYIARSQYDSPDVDNIIKIKSDKQLEIGNFYDVKITKAFDFELLGKIND